MSYLRVKGLDETDREEIARARYISRSSLITPGQRLSGSKAERRAQSVCSTRTSRRYLIEHNCGVKGSARLPFL